MNDLFDWNGDGKLDHWEETNKILFLYYITHQDDAEDSEDTDDLNVPLWRSARNNSGQSGCGTVACIVFILLAIIGFLC